MEIPLKYPLYLIPHSGGYAAILDPESESSHALAVYTNEQDAQAFMVEQEMLGQPRALGNSREFRWLLEALREPIHQVAFDPQPDRDTLGSQWTVSVESLLADHLAVDLSPWNYPAFVIAQEIGFASIQGQTSDGRPLTAVAVFTTAEKAEEYLSAAQETGELCELTDMALTRRFLESLALDVFSVAVDPVIVDGSRSAKYCFDIATLLEKYLIDAD